MISKKIKKRASNPTPLDENLKTYEHKVKRKSPTGPQAKTASGNRVAPKLLPNRS
jgi:hypothetical protein